MKLIPQDNAIVHLVFTVFANYSLTIQLILVNQHLLHRWSGNLSTSNLCTPDTRGRAPATESKENARFEFLTEVLLRYRSF